MNHLELHIDGGRTAFQPGEEISGRATWDLEDTPKQVELRLSWATVGRGTEDVEAVEVIPLGTSMRSDSAPFRFRLPLQPYAFAGKLIALQWVLELVVLPLNKASGVQLVISPTREPIVLHEVAV